jgi:hypothetical protein
MDKEDPSPLSVAPLPHIQQQASAAPDVVLRNRLNSVRKRHGEGLVGIGRLLQSTFLIASSSYGGTATLRRAEHAGIGVTTQQWASRLAAYAQKGADRSVERERRLA